MHHDFFAWVRLLLFIILILAFAMFCSCAETQNQMEQPEPTDPVQEEPTCIAQETTPEIIPTEAELATEPTFSKPLEETTPETEPATIATEPPTAPRETEPPTDTTPPETEPPCATEPTVAPTTEPATEPTEEPSTEPTEETLIEPTETPTEATEPTEPPTEEPAEEWRSLGTYTLTAYCSCQRCCGQYALNRPLDENGKPIVYTSIGAIAQAGVTIAVDPSVIPYGSEVKINDHVYIAQDTGGSIRGGRIDVYFDDHQDALNFGRQYAEVFLRS